MARETAGVSTQARALVAFGHRVPFLFPLFVTLCCPGGRECRSETPEPVFSLSFEPCPQDVRAVRGNLFWTEFSSVLTTSGIPESEPGAQSWSLSMSADGAEIVEVTTRGTIAASVEDDPPGLLDRGFVLNELGEGGSGGCEGRLGALSAAALSYFEDITLPPEGPAVVARITVAGEAPDVVGQILPVRVFYVDGCVGSG